MFELDLKSTHLINGFAGHSAGLDLLMQFFAVYGLQLLVVGTVFLWWDRGSQRQTRHACIAAAISFCASLLANQVLLLFIHRARPFVTGVSHLLIDHAADWGFPSDHVTAAFGIIGALWFRNIRLPLLIGVPLGLLLSFSRVFVGVHYVGDVMAGMLVGLVAGWLTSRFYPSNARPLRKLVKIL